MIGRYIESYDEMHYAIDARGDSQESCKWYEHESDMKAMSAVFPDVLFKLHGEGEESGDIWNAYYLNGKSQKKKARIMLVLLDDVDPGGWK